MNRMALSKPPLTKEEERSSAWSRMEGLSAPSLLIVGSEDFSAIIDRHETLSETMPNAFAALLEGVAHIPSIESPDLVNSLLLQFLDALDGDESDEESDG